MIYLYVFLVLMRIIKSLPYWLEFKCIFSKYRFKILEPYPQIWEHLKIQRWRQARDCAENHHLLCPEASHWLKNDAHSIHWSVAPASYPANRLAKTGSANDRLDDGADTDRLPKAVDRLGTCPCRRAVAVAADKETDRWRTCEAGSFHLDPGIFGWRLPYPAHTQIYYS